MTTKHIETPICETRRPHSGRPASSPLSPSSGPVWAWWTACCGWSPPPVWATSVCTGTRRRWSPTSTSARCPRTLPSRDVLIVDPMLATGGSADRGHRRDEEAGLQAHQAHGPGGRSRGHQVHPGDATPTWTSTAGALDDHLNENGYIVPGLGDAGDRIFGTK